jgi:hypothetical protein
MCCARRCPARLAGLRSSPQSTLTLAHNPTPTPQHLILPLAARCGDLKLTQELAASCTDDSGDETSSGSGNSKGPPARPLLVPTDAASCHFVLVTAARAALRAGRPAAAEWLSDWLLGRARESDIDRADPACEADPFGLLRFCCQHGAAACIEQVPALWRAAEASAAPGAPVMLMRQLAAVAAGRGDAEGVRVCRALLEALPVTHRSQAAWMMLPAGCRWAGVLVQQRLCSQLCMAALVLFWTLQSPPLLYPYNASSSSCMYARSGSRPMRALMVRLAEQHDLMAALPAEAGQSTAALREVRGRLGG